MTNLRPQRMWGIGEWYGRLLSHMSDEERRHFAELQTLPARERDSVACPFRSSEDHEVPCKKDGGVCSLRLYERSDQEVSIGDLATTCPNRFEEQGKVYEWISRVILNLDAKPLTLGQVGFLEHDDDRTGDVGRIDNVLVVPQSNPLAWCAVEMQAVYFQGASMRREFDYIRSLNPGEVVFPIARRQPDFRSSGPKRLMPQLEIKVPTLRRWGRKMAVVVDRSFFNAMGKMETVRHVSNCDIAWFVVKYEEDGDVARLIPDDVYLTTLERSVEGLTAGVPVDLHTFEERILQRIQRMNS